MSTKTLSLTIKDDLYRKLEKQAQRQAVSRSEIFRQALDHYLKLEENWREIYQYGVNKGKSLDLQEKDVNELVQEYRQEKQAKRWKLF